MATQGFRDTPRYERADALRLAGGGPQRAYTAVSAIRWGSGRPGHGDPRFPAGSNDLILVHVVPVALTTDAAGIVKEAASTPFAATQPAFVGAPRTSDVLGLARVRRPRDPRKTAT